MPPILIVHATGGPRRDPASLRLEWVTSTLDGLALAGARVPADLDVDLVDLDGPAATGPAPAPTAWEESVIARWWRTASFDDPAHGPGGGSPVATVRSAEAMLTALGRSRYFVGLPHDELLRAAREMTSYLTADRAARAATARVRAAITPDTRAVIGFGLGSVPAVDALADGSAVETLITLASPLALRAEPALPVPAPPLARPRARTWFNLVDVADGLAARDGLAPLYGAAVRDVSLDCDPRLRAPRPYAGTAEFGRALAH
ncbi:hypothetical protein [Spirillospora sp. CA-294931]|uniref:hypothetical protein n=1 Tax=Spirillospora sp. CA-294931 TaxID=3240042 RepID=UPI003D8B0BFF